MRNKLLGGYAVIWLLFALYGTWWGPYAHKSFLYNVGRSLFWPGEIFPALRELIGIVVVLGIVAALTMSKPR